MSLYEGLVCRECGRPCGPETRSTRCPNCGGILVATYDLERVRDRLSTRKLEKRRPGLWKYIELLPIRNPSGVVSLGEGGTFLQRSVKLSATVGLSNLTLKVETTNPTGSFIDRGTAVAVSVAREIGYASVSCGSTGNLAASLVAYAARAGLECNVFVSQRGSVDVGKLYQILAYDAKVEIVRGDAEAVKYAERVGPHNRTVTPYDPFFLEGVKTTAYEVCEQLGWTTPHWIIVPMGNGGHISMIWKALREFEEAGFIDEIKTHLIGVQAAGCAPIVEAFRRGTDEVRTGRYSSTIAADIGMPRPACGNAALEAIRASGGRAIAVSDKSTLRGAALLAKQEGVFAEPASATTIAALTELASAGVIDGSDSVVCMITGMGLKYPEIARTLVRGRSKLEHLLSQVEERKYTSKIGRTKLLILRILSEGESYGYGVWKLLQSEHGVSISIPSVYQHLAELRNIGLIVNTRTDSAAGRGARRFYALTEDGRWVVGHLLGEDA